MEEDRPRRDYLKLEIQLDPKKVILTQMKPKPPTEESKKKEKRDEREYILSIVYTSEVECLVSVYFDAEEDRDVIYNVTQEYRACDALEWFRSTEI